MTEHRRLRGAEIRATDNNGTPGVSLRAIRPGVVDDYGSVWLPDAFDVSLDERLPVLCWSHDWSEPLGPATGWTASEQGPIVDFNFSDFDAVHQARRAHAQVLDGTIQDCSVGFCNVTRREPTEEELVAYPGVREIIEQAELDEISLVLRGAVPGAKVLAVRSAGGVQTVDESAVLELAQKVADGEISKEAAKAALDLIAGDEPKSEEPPVDDGLDELLGFADDIDPLGGVA